MLYEKTNYTSPISYINNSYIYEYDISKANISVLYTKGVLDEETYKRLYNSPRMIRQKYVGLLEREDHEIYKILSSGIIEAKKMLFEANQIQDHEILSIKNDAVFIIGRKLVNTTFGLINFLCKNIYTSFYKINNLELYYFYDAMIQQESLEIKGINNDKLPLHEGFMLGIIKDLMYTIQMNNIPGAMQMLKDFYMDYIQLRLPVGYYREFNSECMFMIRTKSAVFKANTMTEKDKRMLDISYNVSILTSFQKILASMYFNKV